MQATVQTAADLCGAARAQLWLMREGSGELTHEFVRDRSADPPADVATPPQDESATDDCIVLPLPLRSSRRLLRVFALPARPLAGDARTALAMLVEQAAAAVENVQRFGQLERAKRQWMQIFDGMVEGVYVSRADGVILRANQAAAEMLGLRIIDMIGRKREELHAALANYQVVRDWHPAEHGPAGLGLLSTEFRWGSPERIFNETSFVLGSFESGEPGADDGVHRVRIMRDITDQRRMYEQLMQSEKLAALGELVTGVAHELNNPLTTVVGYAQLLQGDSAVPPRVDRQIAKIHQEAVRASHIVQNLLAFARRSQPHKTWLDINHELRNVLNMREYQLQAEHVTLSTNYGEDLPQVWGDPNQLQQVFLNIINNAAQAMSEWRGSGEIRITTAAARLQNGRDVPGVRVTLEDNGPGIAPEHKRKVFDPFFTTKRVGQGTGLGMSISMGIVQNHNGHIAVESRLGHGASFIVELPSVTDEADVEAPPALETTDAVAPQGRILVVDDEELVVTLITEIMALDGHYVTPAFNGAEALGLLEVHEFDLIISDVRMPAVNGPTFFEILQTTRPDLLTRVIFVTGDTVSPSTQQFLQKTGRPVLAKPFNPERLRSLVNETLALHAAQMV